MAAKEVEIADAVAAELNDAARVWAGQLTAVRRFRVRYKDAELKTLKVAVVPLTQALQEETRGGDLYDYGVVIDFQQWVAPADEATPAALALLAERVQDWFRAEHELATLPGWWVVGAERPELFDLDLLQDDNTWETVVGLTVRGARA